MKKILIFSVAYLPLVGGAEIAVREITNRMLQSEIEFDMITIRYNKRDSREEKIGKIKVYRIGRSWLPLRLRKLLFPFSAVRLAVRLHRTQRYDATWSIMASWSGFAGLFFSFRFPKVPRILTLQEGDPLSSIRRKVRLVYPFFRMIFTRATVIQAISTYLQNFAIDMGSKAPIEVIPNGVDGGRFSEEYPPHEIETLKHNLGKKLGDIFLITTSRLVLKNGVKDMIDALLYLPPRVKAIIVGDGPLRAMLEKHVASKELGDRVRFLGELRYEELPRYLKACDVFVRPSLSEGLGNSFLEAMAAGLPVIGTPVGGIVDYLKDGETGLFATPADPRSVAECVRRLLEDRNLLNSLARNGQSLALKHYDWNTVAKAMHERVFKRAIILSKSQDSAMLGA